MDTLIGFLAFAAFLLAQVTAVVAVHAKRTPHRSDAFEAVRLDPRARVIWDAGG